MDWKKIIKWTVIIFVVLFIIGIISDNKQKRDASPDADLGNIADNLDLGDNTGTATETTTTSDLGDTSKAEADIGLTQEEIDQLEADLNDLQIEDLGGFE